jgi:hypothetical protein
LSQDDSLRIKELLAKVNPKIDQAVGPKREEPVDQFTRRPKKDGRPLIPNLVEMSDEDRKTFLQSAGAQYLNTLMFTIDNIHRAMAEGDFELATVHADFIWVSYPDLAPFLDEDPPSVVIKKRQRDFVNYKWIKYAEIDDAIMWSPDRKYIIPNDKYEEYAAIRDRAIAREYLMFVFIQQVILGCNELGWFLTTDTRVDWVPTEEVNEAQADAAEGAGELVKPSDG